MVVISDRYGWIKAPTQKRCQFRKVMQIVNRVKREYVVVYDVNFFTLSDGSHIVQLRFRSGGCAGWYVADKQWKVGVDSPTLLGCVKLMARYVRRAQKNATKKWRKRYSRNFEALVKKIRRRLDEED